jgi:hypothetical protein
MTVSPTVKERSEMMIAKLAAAALLISASTTLVAIELLEGARPDSSPPGHGVASAVVGEIGAGGFEALARAARL